MWLLVIKNVSSSTSHKHLLDVETQINIKNNIKARAHEATFMLWRGCVILKNVPIFRLNYNLNLCLMDNFCPCFVDKVKGR